MVDKEAGLPALHILRVSPNDVNRWCLSLYFSPKVAPVRPLRLRRIRFCGILRAASSHARAGPVGSLAQ